jgi:diphosphomevalonate decarboxylase
MRAIAEANANVALTKYWGKLSQDGNLPAMGSLSIALEGLVSRTEVVFDPALADDCYEIDGQPLAQTPAARTRAFLDRIRLRAGLSAAARVRSSNSFPTAAGLASSASGFAALATAACAATGLELGLEELADLARSGSGSAGRSVIGGWARIEPGTGPEGRPRHLAVAPHDHWPLAIWVVITSQEAKAVSSREGMGRTAASSPFYQAWVDGCDTDLRDAKRAVLARGFGDLAEIAERNCIRMHAAALGARPPLLYWNGATVAVMHAVWAMRAEGLDTFFTIDAGPQVKVFCRPEHAPRVAAVLETVPGVLQLIRSAPAGGARVLERS